MLESFYIDTHNEREHKLINHPANLDQAVHETPGFHAYCQNFQMEDSIIILTLSILFSEYLIKNFGFKLYKDSEPEFLLRAITLKYNKDAGVLSLYPFKYSLKVLNNEATFQNLTERIESLLTKIPTAKDVLNDLKNRK